MELEAGDLRPGAKALEALRMNGAKAKTGETDGA
jgi:hypothetical protein